MRKKVIPAVAIIFNKNNKMLLVKRNYPDDPKNRYHDVWGFPGGGIDEKEQPQDAAIREVLEETGLKIKIISDRPIVMSCIEQTGNHVVKLGYVAKYVKGTINTNMDSGTSEAGWFSLKEINSLNRTLLTREMARKAFDLIKNRNLC